MQSKSAHIAVAAAFTILVGISLILAMLLIRHDRTIAQEQAKRYQSYLLADELRQSSDDLTRMVRTYAATSDPRYTEYFQNILDIRNGNAPRPEDYHIIYWDFVVATGQTPRQSAAPASLKTLMQEAEFTAEEIALMEQAEAESNDLVNLETEAMNALEGLYKDASGNYTIQGSPDPELARSLLYSEEYHRAKERIMRPIEQFFFTIDRRTAAEIAAHHQQGRMLGMALIAATSIAALLGLASIALAVRGSREG